MTTQYTHNLEPKLLRRLSEAVRVLVRGFFGKMFGFLYAVTA